MNSIKKLVNNIKANSAEYYTLLVINVAVPVAVALLTTFKWALLLSFLCQSIIGVLYIRGTNK